MINEIVYYTSLLICALLGSYYKKIANAEIKRNFGAGLGILVACLICGQNVYHTIFMVWGNVIIIKCCDKRYVHQVSMIYTWSYLLYLHFNMFPTYIIWIHQTIALRLVGLAFEVNETIRNHVTPASSSRLPMGDTNAFTVEPSAVEIISYSFFFIGLHRGPYYKWKIYRDHFSSPFGTLGDCRIITEQKLQKAVVCLVLYWLLRIKFPSEIYQDDNFYLEHGSDYRYLYNVPQLLMYILLYEMVMLLSTSVCTEAGFGVYPAKCEPQPGLGPSTKLSFLKIALDNKDIALEQEYNFAMLKCFENSRLIKGPKMKDTLRGWDMPTRYWFWSNIYKNLLKSNKEVRSASTFFAWVVWCGPSLQQIIFSATLWVYINLETEYNSIYNTTGSMKGPWNIGFSMMRLFCLIYLTPCLTIDDTNTVFKYYNSMFWIFHLILFILVVGAIVSYKSKKTSPRIA